MEQRRNFLHPESAAGLQQARSVPPGCPWPGPAVRPLGLDGFRAGADAAEQSQCRF